MANLCYLQNGGLIDRHCLVTEKGVALCIRDAIGYQDIKNSIKYDFLRNIITLGMAARSAHLGHKGGW